MFRVDRNKSQFSRLMELDRRIRGKEYPNCLSFSADWEVSQKTVQRDIDYLRDMLNAPIEYDRLKKGFYYTDGSWFLPAVSMSEGELFALLVASRALEQYRGTPVAAELERIFAKVAAPLAERVSVRPELVFSRFTFTSPPAKPIDEGIWVSVVRGLLTQRIVRIGYRRSNAPSPTDRALLPLHVANLQGEWYVIGSYEGDPEIRQLSFARIRKAELTDTPFDIPAGFDAGKMLAPTFGRFISGDKVHTIRLLFDAAVAGWVTERVWSAGQKLRKRRNGDIELAFPATGLYEVSRWVLAWGRHVQVLAPAELRQHVRGEIDAMWKRQGGKGSRVQSSR